MPNPLQIDPSRTIMLRRSFVADMNRRFRKLRKSLKKLIVKDDAFGLKEKKVPLQINVQREFAFHTSAKKIDAFELWLQEQKNASILYSPGLEDKWTDEYVYSAYRKGAVRAYADTHKEALATKTDFYEGSRQQFILDAFNAPETKEKIELIFTRTFNDLKGIGAAIDQQLSRELALGLANGWGPEKIAREIDKRVVSINRTRARVLARTEIVRAHAEGQLDAFERLGVEEVGVWAEWSTAGDDRVCELCGPLEGQVMTVEAARGLIPRHPNCRCAWIPSLKGPRKK